MLCSATERQRVNLLRYGLIIVSVIKQHRTTPLLSATQNVRILTCLIFYFCSSIVFHMSLDYTVFS